MILDWQRRRVRVAAVQWLGSNLLEVVQFLGNDALRAYVGGELTIEVDAEPVVVSPGDFLVRERDGALLPPCSETIFQRLYEPRGDAPPTP